MNIVKRFPSKRASAVIHHFNTLVMRMAHFAQRPRVEQHQLFLAILVLPMTTVGMRVLGFKTWYRLLAWSAAWIDWGQSGTDETTQTYRLLHMLRTAIKYAPLRNYCLAQSLTLWWLLRCHGLQGDLRIGVRIEEGKLRAHAWIDYNGSPLNESGDVQEEFVAFDKALIIDKYD